MKNKHSLAILLVILEAFGFAMMTLFIRLSGDLPTMQKVLFRNLVAAIIAAATLMKTEEKFKVKKDTRGLLLLRCVFGFLGMLLNFWAVDHLAIADANILNKMSPFFAIIMSMVLLAEVPNRFEWGMVACAFFGAILVVKPTAGLASLPAVVGLASGFCAGTAYTFVRKLTQRGERSPMIIFAFSAFSVLACLPNFALNYVPMTGKQWFFLIMAGVSAALGQFCVTSAYKLAPAKEISVFDYTQVLFAALLGISFFGEVPDAISLLGYAVIIGTAIVKWRYNIRSK